MANNDDVANGQQQNPIDPPQNQHNLNVGNGFIRPPKPLMVSGDMGNNWRLWRQQYEWFEEATQTSAKPAGVQVATFMSSIGLEAVVIFNTFNLNAAELQNVATIKARFENYFTPQANTTYERYTFNKMTQMEGESFDEFLTKIKSQSRKCEFGDLHDSLLKDKIIIGIRNDTVREKLLSEADLTLQRTTQVCRASELASKQLKVFQNQYEPDVSAFNKSKSAANKSKSNDTYDCKRCGKKHAPKSCPAYQQKCNKCKRKGHFAEMCNSRSKSIQKAKVQMVNENNSSSDDENEFFINSISTNRDDDKNWNEQISIGKVNIEVKLDSGAQCNVIPKSVAKSIGMPLDSSRTKRIITYSGHNIDVAGELKMNTKIRGKLHMIRFIVVNEEVTPVLGKASCEKTGLIKRVKEIRQGDNNSVFDGLGCLKDYEYDIDLVKNPEFVIHAARRLPHAYKDAVKKELDSMVKQNVIKPETGATLAVSPMVVVKQKGRIRICIDPTDVNKNVIRRRFPLTTIEEIATKIAGSTIFTKLDCKKGFWQIKLSEKSQKYLTFATPWGRYSCLKLPFGLCSAPEIFQQIMSHLLSGIDNADASMDDILIYAKDVNQLRKIQKQVIKRIEDSGLTLNKDKCEFEVAKLKFLGHVLSVKGMELDVEKVEAINKLKQPTNKTELQRFLGMVTYLQKFIPNMSDLTQPLRKLLEKETEWEWTSEQEQAIVALKKLLSSPPVLRYYNVNDDVTLQVDASSYALGAALLQNQQPVAFASRSLTKTERRYPQIEKEALAIRYACKKFHEYVYGKKLIVESDHKPLESIFRKPICNAPPRLQRILMDVASYSPTVVYKKGETMHLADILSRDCENPAATKEDEFEVLSILSISDKAIVRLQEDTRKDEELQELQKIVENGWPEDQKDLPTILQPYWTFRDEISSFNKLMYKGQKVIVPSGQKQDILRQIHLGHFGIQRTLSAAREHLFWTQMTKDITNYVERCSICQSTQKSKTREPLITKKVPKLPFEIVATDLFHFKQREYLLLVDSYSGFFDFRYLKQSTSKEVIQTLKSWFAVHGIPATLESDNGPQFSSNEFKRFSDDWKFNHQTSSPRYPKSNGLAERFVQTAKTMLRRCEMDDTEVHLALLNYRNTQRNGIIGSPNQRLMSRTTRSVLPIHENKLMPVIVKNVGQQLAELRHKQKMYHDRVVKPTPAIQVGENVRMQRGPRDWISATVVGNTDKPRSLIVQAENGKQYRRNTIHLCPTKSTIKDPPAVAASPTRNEERQEDSLAPENTLPKPQSSSPPSQPEPSIKPVSTNSQCEMNKQPVVTRSGRTVKKVIKLNL